MMGIVVPETYWAYKKYNKIINDIQLVLFFSYSENHFKIWTTISASSQSHSSNHVDIRVSLS